MSEDKHDATAAWRAAAAAALLAAIGEVAFIFIDPALSRLRLAFRIGHASLCVAVLGVLLLRRHIPTVRLGVTSFLVVGLPLFAVVWLDEAERAASGALWAPFVGPKLAVLGVAFLAPGPLWLGTVLIAALSVETVVLALRYGLAASSPQIVHGEPWITLVYAVIAFGILFHRHRRQEAERAAAVARAEREVLARLARVFLAMRDLANTPFQTLALNVDLLREQHPGATVQLDRMDRALDRLKELNRLLSAYESATRWEPGDESFDAIAVLEGVTKQR